MYRILSTLFLCCFVFNGQKSLFMLSEAYCKTEMGGGGGGGEEKEGIKTPSSFLHNNQVNGYLDIKKKAHLHATTLKIRRHKKIKNEMFYRFQFYQLKYVQIHTHAHAHTRARARKRTHAHTVIFYSSAQKGSLPPGWLRKSESKSTRLTRRQSFGGRCNIT